MRCFKKYLVACGFSPPNSHHEVTATHNSRDLIQSIVPTHHTTGLT
jgi:hypothetical protein